MTKKTKNSKAEALGARKATLLHAMRFKTMIGPEYKSLDRKTMEFVVRELLSWLKDYYDV